MSHNTTIDEIVFSDIKALEAAVADLNKAGVDCELIKDVVPRAYSSGQLGKAPYVLKLNKGRYDVGFYWNKAKGGYEAKTDFFSNYVRGQLGASIKDGESQAQAHMGKLFSAYVIQAATRKAAQQGYSVQRSNKADGSVRLVMTGMAA